MKPNVRLTTTPHRTSCLAGDCSSLCNPVFRSPGKRSDKMTSRLYLYILESRTYSNVSISSVTAPGSKPHRPQARPDNHMAS